MEASSTHGSATAASADSAAAVLPAPGRAAGRGARRFYRHRLPVRVMHWINVVCLFILLMSGLQIFNAHPALYWGQDSNFAQPLAGDRRAARRRRRRRAASRASAATRSTPPACSARRATAATPSARAFPAWATIPGPQWLVDGRGTGTSSSPGSSCINGLAYVGYTLVSGHLRRDLAPTAAELRGIGRSIRDHLLFRHPTGEAAKRYNVLQKLAYLVVIFVLLPLVVICGLAMSPRLDTVFSGWVDLARRPPVGAHAALPGGVRAAGCSC